MHVCYFCNLQVKTYKLLYAHAMHEHSLNPRQYTAHTLFSGGIEPTCLCGCGESVAFTLNTRSFAKYKRGHVARIKNNWGHNPTALSKSQQKRRDQIASGEFEVWNKGLTKKTDTRVANIGKRVSETVLSDPDRRKIRSERMRQNRLNGTIPTVYGADTSQWKGGTSSLNAECHGDGRLYKEWKYPKLLAAKFQCTHCNSSKNLCVHHDKERMSSIIHKFKNELNYDAQSSDHELKRRVIDLIVDYHLKNDISGIVLCYSCHELEHASLNFHKNSQDS